MKKLFYILAVSLFGLSASIPAQAALVAVFPSKDNTLYEDPNGDFSNGAGDYMFAGATGGFGARRAVLAFDVAAAIPAGSTINSARLQLNMSRCGTSCSVSVPTDLRRLLADWGEGASDAGTPGGSGAPSQPGDATWQHTFYNSSFWTNPGGDFSGAITATTNVSSVGLYNWNSPQLAADVQDMLDTPGTNFGWILIGDESISFSAKRYDTRENPQLNLQPVLTIEYTPIPEPATACLLLVGGLFAVRRRKA